MRASHTITILASLLLQPAAAAVASAAYHKARSITIRANKVVESRASALVPVVVGGPQDLFVPNLVRAKVGDVIQFQFSSGNHTVTQSSEKEACKPINAADNNGQEPIHSGHIPFKAGQTEVGTFSMVVTDTEPKFFYCATGPHCQRGQVMVLNPISDQQVVDYAKTSMSTNKSTDGIQVVGGVVAQIELKEADFVVPAEPDSPGGKPPGGAPTGTPPGGAPTGTPIGETPAGDFPGGETPAGEFPAGDFPAGDFPAGDTPTSELPAGGTSTSEKPAKGTPAGTATGVTPAEPTQTEGASSEGGQNGGASPEGGQNGGAPLDGGLIDGLLN